MSSLAISNLSTKQKWLLGTAVIAVVGSAVLAILSGRGAFSNRGWFFAKNKLSVKLFAASIASTTLLTALIILGLQNREKEKTPAPIFVGRKPATVTTHTARPNRTQRYTITDLQAAIQRATSRSGDKLAGLAYIRTIIQANPALMKEEPPGLFYEGGFLDEAEARAPYNPDWQAILDILSNSH